MRAARVVDHVQKIVAKPIARPLSSRAMSCMPSRTGSAMSARLMLEQVLVARRDLVEVAVAAHQREQLGEVRSSATSILAIGRDAIAARGVPGPARDASGNVKKTKATRTVKLAKLKKSKAHKHSRTRWSCR